MNPLKALSATMLAALLSCNASAPSADVTLVIDRTDLLNGRPAASEIITPLTRRHPLQEIHVTVTSISDQDVNDTRTFTLPSEYWITSNDGIRKARISHFAEQVQRALDAVGSGTCAHSIVYRNIAQRANELAASSSSQRVLIVCSDLLEHDSVSFYNPHTLELLKTRPDSIEAYFYRQLRLANLSGIDVWLLYNPRSYRDNNVYITAARFYEHILKSHSATVHIANQFQSP